MSIRTTTFKTNQEEKEKKMKEEWKAVLKKGMKATKAGSKASKGAKAINKQVLQRKVKKINLPHMYRNRISIKLRRVE